MAEQLPDYEFASRMQWKKYPWKEWANGKPWRLKHGVDFIPQVSHFRNMLYAYARRNNLKVTVTVEDDKTIVFKFMKNSTE